MSKPELSLQQANAAAQREKIMRKLCATVVQIRREIRGSADQSSGRCRYVADRGAGPQQLKLTRREVLRRADVDKNTLNRSYHKKSLRAVDRLVSWAAERCADRAIAGPGTHDEAGAAAAAHGKLPSFAKRAFAERDDIAEKFAANEFKLIQSERDLRICKIDLQSERDINQRLTDEIIDLKRVIINLRPIEQDNVVPFPIDPRK